ncbi:MAG: hypothetical protein HQK68_04145 [Desulfamplus sp.]|nr:hypothetical protein [Desulfamplus sp.]
MKFANSKQTVSNILLDIYFKNFLKRVAKTISPPTAYRLMFKTGDKFRDWATYPSGTDEPGALVRASKNLESANICEPDEIKNVISELLYFESRFVMENIWIKNRDCQKIIKSFNLDDVNRLKEVLGSNVYVIATIHTVALYIFVALINILNHKSLFLIANHEKYSWRYSSPLVTSSMQMIKGWKEYQEFIFPDSKDVMRLSKDAINSGSSLVLCMDTPGYPNGVKAELLGKHITAPAGSAILSKDCNTPILLAIPYATDIYKPYKIFLKVFEPVKQESKNDIEPVLQAMFKEAEPIIRSNPACWSGWFYIDSMES